MHSQIKSAALRARPTSRSHFGSSPSTCIIPALQIGTCTTRTPLLKEYPSASLPLCISAKQSQHALPCRTVAACLARRASTIARNNSHCSPTHRHNNRKHIASQQEPHWPQTRLRACPTSQTVIKTPRPLRMGLPIHRHDERTPDFPASR
jgi:hypothetical protein